MNIHICLVSDQLLANYLPIKQLKPEGAFLISTDYTLNKGLTERFEALLDKLGIAHYRAEHRAPDDDYEKLHEYFLNLSEEIKACFPDATLTLNLTGGTKLMAIVANDMLKTDDMRVIYTHTQSNQIQHLHDFSKMALEKDLLSIEAYLFTYGVKKCKAASDDKAWREKAQARKMVTNNALASHFFNEKNHGFLGHLNQLVYRAFDEKEVLIQPTQYIQKSHLNDYNKQFLEKLQRAGLIDYNGENKLTFLSDENARYLGGFWLEEYVYHLAKDLDVQEVSCGQEITWNKAGTRNELDIVMLHNNRMLIIECKTAKFGVSEKDNDIVYKLDSIAENLHGIYGEKWLLSVRKLNERALNRAKSQRIMVKHNQELSQLKTAIEQWKEK